MSRMLAATSGLILAFAIVACAGADAEVEPPASQNTGETQDAGHHHHHDHVDVAVEVSVEPGCIAPGGTASVRVNTAPRTGVLYLAYFSDGESGAKEPLGAGYGGNGGGYADDEGYFSESWTVSKDAPRGPGKLKVITVGDDGERFVEFDIADRASGAC